MSDDPKTQPRVFPLSNESEDIIESEPLLATAPREIEEAKKAHPYWQLRLILTVALGITVLAALIGLATWFGFRFIYDALAMAGYQDVIRIMLGTQAIAFLTGLAIYKKIHHLQAKIYAWLADNWLGKTLGLGTYAGRWGLASRTIRTLAALSYSVLIALVCLDVTTLGELMMPYLITMSITWLGITPGIVANNAKIEQLFEAELRWLDQVKMSLNKLSPANYDTVKNQLTVGIDIPHGFSALYTPQRSDLFISLFIRQIHTINSGIGSLLSLTRFVSAVILPLFYTLSITIPPVFFIVVIGSSILSSMITWYTNWSRLSAHRQMITDIQRDYWKVQHALDPEKAKKVDTLSQRIITSLQQKNAFPSHNSFLVSSITYHLKKALWEHYDFIPENDQTLVEPLTQLIESVIRPSHTPTFLERHINQDQHGTRHGLANSYHFFGHQETTTHSADGLFILENQITQRIIEADQAAKTNIPHHSKSVFKQNYEKIYQEVEQEAPQAKQEHLHLITFGLVTAHSRQHKNNPMELIDSSNIKQQTFFKDGNLDTKAILAADKEGIKDPHGRPSLAPAIQRRCALAA
ncbi:MAG: hypothetical protein GKR77_02860 [Legionellales bacterium]|nr:hypothetical protein [Legionellales bacterium]